MLSLIIRWWLAKEIRMEKYFDYLMALRDSGKVNMFGAAPYLQKEFGLSSSQARDVLSKWMSSFK